MYVLPSTSLTYAPAPSRMNTGVPPTALNARTGELTPPGMSWRALEKAASEFSVDRVGSDIALTIAAAPARRTRGRNAAPNAVRGRLLRRGGGSRLADVPQLLA